MVTDGFGFHFFDQLKNGRKNFRRKRLADIGNIDEDIRFDDQELGIYDAIFFCSVGKEVNFERKT